MDDINNFSEGFYLPPEVLDQIQHNIQDIILKFDIPEGNKLDIIKKINFMYSQTRHMSVTDSLTGLYNRRHLEDNLEREFLRAKRYNSELSFAMLDIDFFKNVNDNYGHSFGDLVLKEIAFLLLQTFRKTDMVFRYGGEEFAIIITETSKDKALIPLERLRKTISEHPFVYDGITIKVTVSIGVSDVNKDVETVHQLFELADKALYKSKENGRNQVNL